VKGTSIMPHLYIFLGLMFLAMLASASFLREVTPVFEKITAYLLAPPNADCYSKF